MESWSGASRSAIQDAFNALRQTIGRELENEIEHRLQEEGRSRAFLIEELELLRSRSAEVDRLEEENRKLRTKLLEFHQQSRGPEPPRESPCPKSRVRDRATNTEPITTKSSAEGGDVDEVLRQSQKLYRRYNKLDTNFKVLKTQFSKGREEIKKWEQYAASLEDKIKSIEKRHGSSIDPAHATRGASGSCRPTAAAMSSFASDLGPVESVTDDKAVGASADIHAERPTTCSRNDVVQDLSPTDPAQAELIGSSKDADLPTLPPLNISSNSTSHAHVKSEPSSDGPVFVSERYVGKRKHPGDSASESPRRQRVKMESSGLSATGLITQVQHESLDLDVVGQKLSTPRKNRTPLNATTSADTAQDKTIDHVFVRPDVVDKPNPRPSISPAVLTPINPNAQSLERNAREKPTKKGLAQGIGSLAEDGLVYKTSGRREPGAGQFRTPQSPGRLKTLLNMPSPEKTPSIIRSAPRPRDASRWEDEESLFPERRELPFTKERQGKPRETASIRKQNDEPAGNALARGLARGQDAAGTSLLPKPSLRSKPVASLRLDDFKVNPKFNGGSDYAFSEVVRGHERACLPGCTDINCCGKTFRAMALAQKNNVERTPASDNKLFEDYLGDRISSVWGMSKAEKDELWIEAKAWQLANELGKHRHRYARRSSPPGFWNADFPDTQEVKAEKAEAEKREKQMVQDRYREAMRGGGRWVFRDE